MSVAMVLNHWPPEQGFNDRSLIRKRKLFGLQFEVMRR